MNDVPPNDLISERSVIGAGFCEAGSIDVATDAGLRPHHFYNDLNGAVFGLQQRLRADRVLVAGSNERDILRNHEAIMTELHRVKVAGLTIAEQVTGGLSEFVAEYTTNVPYAYQVMYYVGRVLETSRKRVTLSTLDNLRSEAVSGADPETIAERLTRAADGIREGLTPRHVERAMTCRQLDEAEFQIDYLIPGILARRQFCIVAGPSKGCKTTMLADLGMSLSNADRFLNEFTVPHAVRVGMISAESGRGVLQETARRIAKSKQWKNLSDYENLVWKFEVPRLNQPGAIRSLIEFVKEDRLDVLILDPFYLMAGLSENASNLFVVGPLLADLQVAGNETGVTLVVAHHFKKLGVIDQYATPELGMISWSGFEQYARQWLLLNRREAFDAETGLHKLWLAVGGSAGHGGLFAVDALEGRQSDQGGRRWEVSVTKASEARQQAKQEREERKDVEQQEKLGRDIQAVLDVLAKHPGGISKSLLRDESGVGGRIAKILPVITGDGRAESCRFEATNGQEYPGFKLATRTLGQALGQLKPSDCPTDTTHTLGQRSPLRERGRPSDVSVSDDMADQGDHPDRVLSECETDHIGSLFGGGRPA